MKILTDLLAIMLAVVCALPVSFTFVTTQLNNEKLENETDSLDRVTIVRHELLSKKYTEPTEEQMNQEVRGDIPVQFLDQDGEISRAELMSQIFNSILMVNNMLEGKRPKYNDQVASVLSGEYSAKGVYIRSNIVLTCYHVLDTVSNEVIVNGYPSKILEVNPEEDYMVLETVLDSSDYVRDCDADNEYILSDNIIKGDSGLPAYDRLGRLFGIVIGKRSDGTIKVLDTRNICKNFL